MTKISSGPSAGLLGLYIHVPFCQQICHYCDFAKTARWDSELADKYFAALKRHFKWWIQYLALRPGAFYSVNFGGGTPTLFSQHCADLLQEVLPYCRSGAEVSIEANPADCNEENLQLLRAAGFNRISLGVQSFHEETLTFLKRDHSAKAAYDACALALRYFPNTNLDLIYAVPGQSHAEFLDDIGTSVGLGVPHFSFYNLTYAAGTPIGRAMKRGRISEQSEEMQESMYRDAGKLLAQHGYIHDEISNWAKPGFDCQHNWLYWQDGYYLGLGSGAHGYLPSSEAIGMRYAYSPHERGFARQDLSCVTKPEAIEALNIDQRTDEGWLLEYLSCGLRSKRGVSLKHIHQKAGYSFNLNSFAQTAIRDKKLFLSADVLILSEEEWFREERWALELSACFRKEE